MNLQYILEIENFDHGRNLILDVHSVIFSHFPHLPLGTVGASIKTAEMTKEVTISRSLDHYSHLFLLANQTGKSFPKAVLRVKSSGGGKRR